MNKKIIILAALIMLMLLTASANIVYERWSSNVNAKNMLVKSLWIRDTIDLWHEENILKSADTTNAKAVFADTENNIIYDGQAKMNGDIFVDGGKVSYKIISFKPDYSEVDSNRAIVEGNAVVEYTITIKKQMPVHATFWFEQYDFEKTGYVEFSSDNVTFEAVANDFNMQTTKSK